MALDALDQMTERAVRQAGEAGVDVTELFQGVRSAASSVAGTFTVGARADRLSAVGMVEGDRWLETTGWEYYFDGLAWKYAGGVYTGTDAERGSVSLTADDNGALFLTTDTIELWEAQAGAWVQRLKIEGAAGEIETDLTAGVITLSLGEMNAVANPTGGAIVDAECRAAVIALLDELRTRGDLP